VEYLLAKGRRHGFAAEFEKCLLHGMGDRRDCREQPRDHVRSGQVGNEYGGPKADTVPERSGILVLHERQDRGVFGDVAKI
jgi:hypothetical protein